MDDIANKISFLLEKNILSNKCTSKGDLFYFAENVDNIVEVVEDIVESVDENVEDRDIIHNDKEHIAGPVNPYVTANPNTPESSNMENEIIFIKAELLAVKSFVTAELYSLSRIMDRIRTEYDQSKILEKNENLRNEISSKGMIIKMLSESLSQITNSFNEPNSIRSTRSIEKIVDRKKFEFFQEKSFIQPNKTIKASNNNGSFNGANCNIFSPNRYENLEADDTNSNTRIDITDADYNRNYK